MCSVDLFLPISHHTRVLEKVAYDSDLIFAMARTGYLTPYPASPIGLRYC